jgi:nucleoside-diphosphate kinase
MERTLCIIKPDAVKKKHTAKILQMIIDAGFEIIGMKMLKLTSTQAESFYAIHKDKPFFKDLVAYITSGQIVAVALQKDNAVEDYRKLIGATDPLKAEEGTIRKLFATSIQENAVHGSDSIENGKSEVAFFFAEMNLTI